MPEQQWFYNEKGQRQGPVSKGQLEQLVASGKLSRTDLVWRQGMKEWIPFEKAILEPSGDSSGDKTDAEKVEGLSSDSAVILHADYFGGCVRLGRPLSDMKKWSFIIAAALVSWLVIIPFLLQSRRCWQFVPFKRPEFARITLSQSVKWHMLMPTVLVFFLSYAVLGAIARVLIEAEPSFGLLVASVGSLAINVVICRRIAGMGEMLMRTKVYLEYGFPRKYRLLCGYSDAPLQNQVAGVKSLCEAISRSEFAPWPQISTHGSTGGLIGAIYGRVSQLFS